MKSEPQHDHRPNRISLGYTRTSTPRSTIYECTTPPTHQPSTEEDRQAGRVHYHSQHSDHYFHHLLHQYQITMALDAFLQRKNREKLASPRKFQPSCFGHSGVCLPVNIRRFLRHFSNYMPGTVVADYMHFLHPD
jgi:hypothetical protein